MAEGEVVERMMGIRLAALVDKGEAAMQTVIATVQVQALQIRAVAAVEHQEEVWRAARMVLMVVAEL
jgi:hypothetical protein